MTAALVIDTNVIEHVFDPVKNGDGHIDSFLRKFSEQKRKLCIDKVGAGQKSRIIDEYRSRLEHHLKGIAERGLLFNGYGTCSCWPSGSRHRLI